MNITGKARPTGKGNFEWRIWKQYTSSIDGILVGYINNRHKTISQDKCRKTNNVDPTEQDALQIG